ncbi:MAG: HlyD family efflux transporter periplasmic adaptor subunit [Anaerolineae bacterium]|nr:HlyD family efflux transporter periplasmic adaptor subunit [Anaerolineae bacterium]
MKRWSLWFMLALLLVVPGCGQSSVVAQPELDSELISAVYEDAKLVNVTGVVEPARSVVLRAKVSGIVNERLVSEGDTVLEGTVLLRLDPTDAELSAQQAAAALAVAEAQLALVKAGPTQEQLAVMEAQLAAAEAGVSQATAQRDEQAARGTGVADAMAQVAEADAARYQADNVHSETLNCVNVQLPDGSKREVCPALGTLEELSRAQLEAATASLAAANAQLGALQQGSGLQSRAAQAGVQSAIAARDAVLAEIAMAKTGVREEQIAVSQAEVLRVQSALEAANSALDYVELKAPFDATITDMALNPGDVALQGEPLVTLATLDQLQVRTKDLTELDVVNITVGQPAAVRLDAYPGKVIEGYITRIEPQSVDYLGDVTYIAFIDLTSGTPEWVRWGMSAHVEISVGE